MALMFSSRLATVTHTTWWRASTIQLFYSQSTDHGRGAQSYVGLADIFGVYFPGEESVYLVPIGAVADTKGRLRLEPARNNQKRRVRLAAEFEIGSWTPASLAELVA